MNKILKLQSAEFEMFFPPNPVTIFFIIFHTVYSYLEHTKDFVHFSVSGSWFNLSDPEITLQLNQSCLYLLVLFFLKSNSWSISGKIGMLGNSFIGTATHFSASRGNKISRAAPLKTCSMKNWNKWWAFLFFWTSALFMILSFSIRK